MKIKLIIQVFLLILCNTPALYSQPGRVEILDFYGRGYTKISTFPCLPFRENDTVSFLDDDSAYYRTVTEIESCLLKQSGIRQAEIAFVCCTQPQNNWTAYVGLDTAAAPILPDNKTADIFLPKELNDKYDRLIELLIEAIEKEEADEDNAQGHSMIKYGPAQNIQKEFIAYANTNLKLLRSVMQTSKYPGEREVAAMVIAYHTSKKEIINDLLNAATDPEANVRNNAIRAIGIIAEYAQNNPELNLQISASPFIALMNSISWTDRNKSGMVLLSLTQKRNPEIILELKAKALKSITDMASWKNFGHSMPGYILLGRIIGWNEEVIMSGINNERRAQIDEMLKAMK